MRKYFFRTPVWVKRLYPDLIWDRFEESTASKPLYLTFDDGPIPEVTPWVLEQLKIRGIKATFFQVGDNLRKYPEVLKEVVREGHRVGNHTFNHLNGYKVPEHQYLENVALCRKEFLRNGLETDLFRPPYGKIRRRQAKVLKGDYQIIMWDYLSGDFDPSLSAEQIISQFKRKVRPGSIVVFHDNIKTFTILQETLPVFLDFFKGQGYHFLTL